MLDSDTGDHLDPPLRVLHVVSGDLWAGAEVQVHELLRAASRLPELELHAVVLNPGILAERLERTGIGVTVLDESRQSFPGLAQRILQLARRWRPAVIHTHRRKEHLLGAMAAVASGAAVVGTVHGRGEFAHSRLNLRQKALRALEQLVLTRVHKRLIAVSDEMVAELPGPAAHTVVIPNSIDVEALRQAAEPTAPEMEPDGRIRIAFLGRLVPVKQVDRMLEMMALLETEHPGRYILHIVGDGPLRQSLERQVLELGLEGAVFFHGFRPDPLPLLAGLQVFLFASAHEGLPMTALEALSLGVPLISPPIGSLSQLIAESGAGRVANSSLPRDLADAVVALGLEPSSVQGPRPSFLPKRYHIDQGVSATAQLWRDVTGRKLS